MISLFEQSIREYHLGVKGKIMEQNANQVSPKICAFDFSYPVILQSALLF